MSLSLSLLAAQLRQCKIHLWKIFYTLIERPTRNFKRCDRQNNHRNGGSRQTKWSWFLRSWTFLFFERIEWKCFENSSIGVQWFLCGGVSLSTLQWISFSNFFREFSHFAEDKTSNVLEKTDSTNSCLVCVPQMGVGLSCRALSYLTSTTNSSHIKKNDSALPNTNW